MKYEKGAVHKRNYKPYRYTYLPEHQASSQRVITEWNPEKFLKETGLIHTDVENYIRHVIEAKPYPEQSYKSCRGILSFTSRVDKKRLINAYRWASDYGLHSYPAIEEILKNRQDESSLEEEVQDEGTGMPTHENIQEKNIIIKNAQCLMFFYLKSIPKKSAFLSRLIRMHPHKQNKQ